LKIAGSRRGNTIAEVDKAKKLSTMSKHGLDTQRRPFWYDGRVVIDRNEVRG